MLLSIHTMQNLFPEARGFDADKRPCLSLFCATRRERILRNMEGPDQLSYYISMVDLFATCAEVRICQLLVVICGSSIVTLGFEVCLASNIAVFPWGSQFLMPINNRIQIGFCICRERTGSLSPCVRQSSVWMTWWLSWMTRLWITTSSDLSSDSYCGSTWTQQAAWWKAGS